jgi:hypothetical protein
MPDPALTEVVGLAASRGTLCLAMPHVTEIAAIPLRERALAIARWLRDLDHCWIGEKDAEREELAHAVRAVLGLTTEPARLPVHNTMTSAIRPNLVALTPAGSNQILRDPTIAGLIRECHGRLDWDQPKRFNVEQLKLLHFDRGHVPPGTTPDMVRDQTRVKVHRGLKVKARSLLEHESTDAEIDAAVDLLFGDPLALPINRISPHLWAAIADRILAQKAESKSFADRYGSMIWDLRHAIAGAFADVFTCDRLVADFFGDFRMDRGLQRQLSVGGGVDRAAFAAALRQQIEAVAAST